MYTVMIVDDDEVTCNGTSHYLQNTFPEISQVWVAHDGETALALYETHRPDFLFTDIAMPRMDGLELIEKLHLNGYYPEIVILSAHKNFEYAQSAIQEGVQEYLIKPILPVKLKQVMERLLSEQKERNQLVEDMNALRAHFQMNLPQLRERFLYSLVFSSHRAFSDAAALFEQAARLEIDLHADMFAVAILRLCSGGTDMLLSGQLAQQLERNADMLPAKIRYYGFTTSSADTAFLLTGSGETPELFFRSANASLNALLSNAQRQLGVDVRIALGRTYSNVGDIPRAYADALEVLSCARSGPAESAVENYRDVSPISSIGLPTAALEERLYHSVRHRSLAECMACTDALTAVLYPYWMQDPEYVKTYFLKVAVLIWRDLQNANGGHTPFAVDFSALLGAEDMDRCMQWFSQFVHNIVEGYGRMDSGKGSSLFDRAKLIIAEKLSDSSLCIDDVSAQLFISSSYLRQIFKQQSDESFVEYLTRIRMEKALRLLKNSNLKILEIAEQTGFSNQRYFSVCFKKYYGKTPTDFRK